MIFHDRRRLGAIRRPFASAVGYQGPADAVGATPFAWYGLRAMSAAAIGANAVDIARSGGSSPATATFTTVASAGTLNIRGGLDIDGITTFKAADGSTALSVTKLWDQTGGVNHFTPGGPPPFNLSGFGSLPTIDPPGGSNLFTPSFTPPTLPLTFVIIAKHATSVASQVVTGGGGGGIAIIFRDTADNQVTLYNGGAASAPHVTATDNQYNSIIANFASPSSGSFITVGGVDSATGDPGSSSGSAGVQALFSNAAGGSSFNGGFQELGIWAGAFSGTQRTNMYNNHHAYYGV